MYMYIILLPNSKTLYYYTIPHLTPVKGSLRAKEIVRI